MSIVTYSDARRYARDLLLDGGIENAVQEAKWIMQYITNSDAQTLLTMNSLPFPKDRTEELEHLLNQRISGVPLQYLIGNWTFYGREFFVGEGVLIPRPETETLVEEALNRLRNYPSPHPKVLDLCSGSGCIGITIKEEFPQAEVICVEKEHAAFEYLQKNAEFYKNRVKLIKGDVLEGFLYGEAPDFVLCNPPYLTAEDMKNLQKEVTFEPETALYGDDDGLLFYRELPIEWFYRMVPGGHILFEIGAGQEKDVADYLAIAGFEDICTLKDDYGIIRVVAARRPEHMKGDSTWQPKR